MYSVCGRKQESDKEVTCLFITDKGGNLEEKKKQHTNFLSASPDQIKITKETGCNAVV
jgi:hypothetical protein